MTEPLGHQSFCLSSAIKLHDRSNAIFNQRFATGAAAYV